MQDCNFSSFYAQYQLLEGLKQMKIPYVLLPLKLRNSRFNPSLYGGGGGGVNLPPRQFFATVQKRLALDF